MPPAAPPIPRSSGDGDVSRASFEAAYRAFWSSVGHASPPSVGTTWWRPAEGGTADLPWALWRVVQARTNLCLHLPKLMVL